MKKTVLTFGLIAGAILSLMMLGTLPFIDKIGFDKGEIIGYTGMVLAFLLVFFGIRSYRENIGGGAISFGRAFSVGILITLVGCLCYVVTWEIIYFKLAPGFLDKYSAYMIEKLKASGASQAVIEAKLEEMKNFKLLYANPLINAAISSIEPLPVGLIVTLISAAVLRRKRRAPETAA
ncbi:MAG: DUF4199 domain-containing protein [bacterium]